MPARLPISYSIASHLEGGRWQFRGARLTEDI